MAQQQGVIQRKFTKTLPSGVVLHSFCLKGVQGFFGTGEDYAPQKEGTYIIFDFDPNNRNRVDMSSIKVLEQDSPAPTSSGAARSTQGTSTMSKDEYWRNKEERDIITQKIIQYQSARNSAISVVGVALEHGALKVPAKEAGKALDLILGYVKEITLLYYNEALKTDSFEEGAVEWEDASE